MSAHTSDSCLVFCTPHEHSPGQHQIQWQFPMFTLTCTSTDLGFTQAILDFVTETRSNPEFRDTPLGDGVYHYADEKCVDLSPYFQDTQVRFEKLGESDHSYLLVYGCTDGLSAIVEMRTPEMIDSFVDGIQEIVDDYVLDSER